MGMAVTCRLPGLRAPLFPGNKVSRLCRGADPQMFVCIGHPPPRSIHPHKRRQRMSKLAMFATVFALGLAPVRTAAQGREVTGRVIRAVGEVPVAGATIIEVGGQSVTQSGTDGSFRIAVAAGEVRVLVRAIGYERKVVVVN